MSSCLTLNILNHLITQSVTLFLLATTVWTLLFSLCEDPGFCKYIDKSHMFTLDCYLFVVLFMKQIIPLFQRKAFA